MAERRDSRPLDADELRTVRQMIQMHRQREAMNAYLTRGIRLGWAIAAAVLAITVVVLQALVLYHTWGS
jgi:hypothetical protein